MSLRLGFFVLTGAGKHYKVVEEEPKKSRQVQKNLNLPVAGAVGLDGRAELKRPDKTGLKLGPDWARWDQDWALREAR